MLRAGSIAAAIWIAGAGWAACSPAPAASPEPAPDVDAGPDVDAAEDGSGVDPLAAWRDGDNDGIPDRWDLCPLDADPEQADGDRDGVGDACDLCPLAFDPGQDDIDQDGQGDACERAGCESQRFCGDAADPLCCDWGEECVNGACIGVCAFGVRCGGICCPDGEICLGGRCALPGAVCTSDSDCDFDAYCDRAQGRCLPLESAAPACERPLPDGDFALELAWHWDGATVGEVEYAQVMAVPAVADLDRDGVPDVVFPAYSASLTDAVLVAVDGASGSTALVWSAVPMRGGAHPAVGQIDADPALEVVVVGRDDVVALDDPVACPEPAADVAGCVLWRWPWDELDSNSAQPSVALHDLDADGRVEAVVGNVVLDAATGELVARGGGSSALGLFATRIPVVADLDGDGQQELLTGDCAWRVEREAARLVEVWCNDDFDEGYPGVADIVGDAGPEVVVVRDGTVYVLDGQTGSTLHQRPLPDGGHGGAPNMADFDGDGRVEIGVAGAACYTVFDVDCFGDPAATLPGCTRPSFPDCTPGVDCSGVEPCGDLAGGTGDGVLWSVATRDASSNMTGSSVFDFEGDGRAEVVYNDECRLYALDGASGSPYLLVPNSTRTGSEYPIVVNVDGDVEGTSEIVVVSNNDSFARDCADLVAERPDWFPDCHTDGGELPAFCSVGTRGVRAWRDPAAGWVRTRAIWNQHAYAITNVGDDGSIPALPTASWSGSNTFRANRQGAQPRALPDLSVENVQIDSSGCPTLQRITARIGNRGAASAAAGVRVGLYAEPGAALELTATTSELLPPGGSTLVVFERRGPLPAVNSFRVVLQPAEGGPRGVDDCDAANDELVVETTCPCQPEFCDGVDNDCNRLIDEDGCLECGLLGDPCSDDGDCCALACVAGGCGVPCRPVGVTCTSAAQCCEGPCSGTIDRPGFCVGL